MVVSSPSSDPRLKPGRVDNKFAFIPPHAEPPRHMCNLYVLGNVQKPKMSFLMIHPVSSQIGSCPFYHEHPVRRTPRVDIRKAHRAFLQCPVSPFRTLWNEQLVKRRNGF